MSITARSGELIGPSAIAHGAEYEVPREMTREDIHGMAAAWAAAAGRALEAGFEIVEIHGAHGYLLHQFLSRRRHDQRWKNSGFDSGPHFAHLACTSTAIACGSRNGPPYSSALVRDLLETGIDEEVAVSAMDFDDLEPGFERPSAAAAHAAAMPWMSSRVISRGTSYLRTVSDRARADQLPLLAVIDTGTVAHRRASFHGTELRALRPDCPS